VEFRVVFQQDENLVTVHTMTENTCMSLAVDIILGAVGTSTKRLSFAELTLKYQCKDGAGYMDLVEGRSLGEYLSDRANHAAFTQGSNPSLYVSLHHRNTKIEGAKYSPQLSGSSDMPEIVTLNIVHNTTLYHVCESFRPDQCAAPIIDFILEQMISQGDRKPDAYITSDDIVLYYNGMIPMMKNIPIIAYSLVYGVDTAKELAKPIVVSFSIIGKMKIRTWMKPFLAAYDLAEPVILTYHDLRKDIRQVAVSKILSTPGTNPMQDRRYVYLSCLFNDLLLTTKTENKTINKGWLKRFLSFARKNYSSKPVPEVLEHDLPKVYPNKTDYHLVGNHLLSVWGQPII